MINMNILSRLTYTLSLYCLFPLFLFLHIFFYSKISQSPWASLCSIFPEKIPEYSPSPAPKNLCKENQAEETLPCLQRISAKHHLFPCCPSLMPQYKIIQLTQSIRATWTHIPLKANKQYHVTDQIFARNFINNWARRPEKYYPRAVQTERSKVLIAYTSMWVHWIHYSLQLGT